MTVKQQLEKYIDIELPAEQLLFHVAMLLGLAECLGIAFFAMLLRLDIRVSLLLFMGAVITVGAIWAERKGCPVKWISAVYLCAMHFAIVPAASFFVPYAIYDFPIYFLTGITFTVILLKKRWAALFIFIDMAIDLFCFRHMLGTVSAEEAAWSGDKAYRMLLFVRIIVALFLTGTVCGILISYRNRMLRREIDKSTDMEQRAQQLSYAKNMFLVNVSHEIRTPLNAILGITELLQDMDVEESVKENAFHLTNSSRALLSITNELMDFSKLDDSDLIMAEKPYYIGDILNELINMVSVRFADCRIEWYVDIDPDIPAQPVGDAGAVRRLLRNIMIGIMKSIESGKLYLHMHSEEVAEGRFHLLTEIRFEGTFAHSYREWLYRKQPQYIECDDGYMPMIRRLIMRMGGELHMEEGAAERSYTFDIWQGYQTTTPLVVRPIAGSPRILFYEYTTEQGEQFAASLRALGVDFHQAFSDEYFCEACTEPGYTHIMVAAERYEGIKDRLAALLGPQAIILTGANMMIYEEALVRTTFARPVNCLNLEALLSGRQNSTIRHIGYKGGFICPDAHVMVVDDNLVNLEVATSLLNRYKAQVSVAASGKECLKMLRQEPVDLIFLDYMMPEMDGIDTLKNIRALGDAHLMQVPIVALTANAVSGAREMFLEAGFDEYISKPIERDQFEKVLRTYLPREMIIYTDEQSEKAQ